MPPATKTRRRWFQFGLRTLLVVMTGIAMLIAYHVSWIRQRHEALSRASHLAAPIRAPGLLWLFGEQGYGEIDVVCEAEKPELAASESDRIADLFPEAQSISVYGVPDTW